MKTVIISQARMTSTRLPGKVMKPVLGRPLLAYHIERLQQARQADEVVIATTTNATDDTIVDLCKTLGVSCFRGSEDDVLARYHGAAREAGAGIVVRVTSDCPLIDPRILDRVIAAFKASPGLDYLSNIEERSYPRGMDTEVFSFAALDRAFREATLQPDREHVTPYICMHPALFKLGQVANDKDESRHRWTVDTIEDFTLIEKILGAIYPGNPRYTMQDVLDLFETHPDWFAINQHVEQKQYGQ